MKSTWNPRPHDAYNSLERTNYLAGYQDGYHEFDYGTGYDHPGPTYRIGWHHAREDRRIAA